MTNSETERLVREVGQAMLADAIGQEGSMGGVSYKLLALIALRAIHDAGYRIVPAEPTETMHFILEWEDYDAILEASPIQPEEGE